MHCSDAVCVQKSGREKLLIISRNIAKRNLPYLKLLVLDKLDSDYASICDTKALFIELKDRGCIFGDDADDYDGLSIVMDALYHMKQIKLLSKMGVSKTEIELRYKCEGSKVSDYCLFLHGLATRLNKNDIRDMKFLLTDSIPQDVLEEIASPAELILLLDAYGYMSRNDVSALKKLLSQLPKKAIVKYVDDYEASIGQPSESSINGDNNQSSNQVVNPNSACMNSGYDTGSSSSLNSTTGSEISCNTMSTSLLEHPSSSRNGESIPTTVFETEDLTVKGGDEGSSQTTLRPELDLPEMYPMTSRPRGKCLVICNYIFPKVEALEDRKGSECDLENLKYLFDDKLNFELHDYHNLKAEEIVRVCREFAVKVDHSKFDCFACIILSHGELGCVYGSDGGTVHIRDITYLFSAVPCPSLKGKPKLFFIQACQGVDAQMAVNFEADDVGGTQDTLPNESDFLYAYSTLPGYRSFRSPKFGSWFIVQLLQVIEDNYQRMDLLSMLTIVNKEVAELATKEGKGHVAMCPAPMYTLRKQVWFM